MSSNHQAVGFECGGQLEATTKTGRYQEEARASEAWCKVFRKLRTVSDFQSFTLQLQL